MSNILTVMNFELKSIFRKRSVIVTTIIMAIFVLVATSIPTIINLFSDDNSSIDGEMPVSSMQSVGFVFESDSLTYDELSTYFNSELLIYENEDSLKTAINDETINNGYIISDSSTITSIVINKDMYSTTDQMIVNALQYINRNKALLAMDIDPAQVDAVSYQPVMVNEIILGKDASSSFLLSYILMFAVYMLVIMYGAFVSTSVAREKDNRTMEILITSTSPKALIIGKVFANALGGLIQFGIIITVGLIGYLLNQHNYPTEIIQMVFAGFSWDAALVFVLFTAVGYTLYLFLYASLGSLVSKVEDVGSSTTPITMLFMIAYFISAFAINMPKGLIITIGSYVPFTAILVMPIRYFLTSVPLIELIISIGLMALTAIALAYVSIKIYRLGSLNYGNKISFIKAIKMIFAKDNIDLVD
ncbi:MAG: ABC transporter permease [Erysipelotrichaceae bacterium]|nr:ABC transporter permease [Erysipelotrichaceae bacterium]MDD4642751.1 ABC transporter permease [Erysipelotrichaceae bacterium]